MRLGDYQFEWSSVFASKKTQPYKPANVAYSRPEIKQKEQGPNVHVHLSQEGKHKGLEAWDTSTRGLLNFGKAAFYIALAIIFFYIVYLIFKYLL